MLWGKGDFILILKNSILKNLISNLSPKKDVLSFVSTHTWRRVNIMGSLTWILESIWWAISLDRLRSNKSSSASNFFMKFISKNSSENKLQFECKGSFAYVCLGVAKTDLKCSIYFYALLTNNSFNLKLIKDFELFSLNYFFNYLHPIDFQNSPDHNASVNFRNVVFY